VPYSKAVLAEGVARTGAIEEGLNLVQEALAQIERPGWEERACLAEVLRVKGWLLQQKSEFGEAEYSLRAAIDVARGQQAKAWELRAATTLAGLLDLRGHRDAAREVLAPIYNWFTEGFDTRDLREAKALLDELS